MLVDHEIKSERHLSNIHIEPFNADQLNSNSYDVKLGRWFCIQQDANHKLSHPHLHYLKGLALGQVTFILSASPASVMWTDPIELENYTISPGETILAHTEEVIGGVRSITTEMRAKSTVGRSGIEVCKCAGLGDVGFVSRWTMEITNNSLMPVLLIPGVRIAQIIFFTTKVPHKSYKGRYGQGEWTPQDMLPKPSKDGDI